jgi:hypothetical protein
VSEPIKVGDLVVLVRGHECALAEAGGVPFVFNATYRYTTSVHCARCKADPLFGPGDYPRLPKSLGGWVVPMTWLKRIPPLDELEREQEKKEITA